MLETRSKVAAEPAVSGVMHPDHRAPSLASIARPAGDARYMAAACQSHPNTLTDRPSTVDSQRFVLPRTRTAGGDPARLANDHRAAGSLPARWPRAVPDLADDERLHPPTPALQSRAITATAGSRLLSASIQGDSYCLAPPQLIAFHCTNHCTVGEDRRRSNSRRRAAGGKDVRAGRGGRGKGGRPAGR